MRCIKKLLDHHKQNCAHCEQILGQYVREKDLKNLEII